MLHPSYHTWDKLRCFLCLVLSIFHHLLLCVLHLVNHPLLQSKWYQRLNQYRHTTTTTYWASCSCFGRLHCPTINFFGSGYYLRHWPSYFPKSSWKCNNYTSSLPLHLLCWLVSTVFFYLCFRFCNDSSDYPRSSILFKVKTDNSKQDDYITL